MMSIRIKCLIVQVYQKNLIDLEHLLDNRIGWFTDLMV